MHYILALLLTLITVSQAFAAAAVVPAFGTASSASGGKVSAGQTGSNTLNFLGATVGKVGGKPTVTIPWQQGKSALDFFDGQSGRPTLAAWQANQAGTDATLAMQAAIDYSAQPGNLRVVFPAGTFAYTQLTLRSNMNVSGQGMGKTFFQALASAWPYSIVIEQGPVVKTALSDITFYGSNALGQGCMLLEATARAGSPYDGGLWWANWKNITIDHYDGIGMWFKGGYSGSLLPNQFNNFDNINIFVTPRVGNRALKITGQAAQFNFIGGQFDAGYGNTPATGIINIQVSRELTNDDPSTPLGDNAPSFIRFIGATTQGADKGIWFDRASNCEVNAWFENTYRAVTIDTAARGIIVKGSHFANAGSDGAGGGYLVKVGATSTATVEGNYASGSIDTAWVATNSAGMIQRGNFIVTAPTVATSAGNTIQLSIAGDGSITLGQHRTALVNTSATALQTINTDIGVGESITITALGGSVVLSSTGNLHLPAGAAKLTLISGEPITLTRMDLFGDLVVTALPRKNSGSTANRPVLQSGESGFDYYDTDLGKKVYWNGSVWKETATTGFNETFGGLTSDTAVNSHSGKIVLFDDGTYTPQIKLYRWTGASSNYYQETIGPSSSSAGDFDIMTGISGGAAIGSDTQTAVFRLKRAGRLLLGNLTDDASTTLQVNGSMSATTVKQTTGTSTNKAVCWKSTGILGYCSTQPDSTGACTCN